MELLVFTVYMKRVGDTKEWPVSEVIAEDEEDAHRQYHRGLKWNEWADRNRVYRNVRIEVVKFEYDKHKEVHHSDRVKKLLQLTQEFIDKEKP